LAQTPSLWRQDKPRSPRNDRSFDPKLSDMEPFVPRVHSANVVFGRGRAMRLILLIILIILLVGALPSWPYSAGWGYYPAGGLGTILVILVILALVGVI
jgi:hypothetical protein